MSVSYLGAFLDPLGTAQGLPVVVVNRTREQPSAGGA